MFLGRGTAHFREPFRPAQHSAFSPSGRFVLFGSWNNTLGLWDTATSTSLLILGSHFDFVSSFVLSPDVTSVVSKSYDDQCVSRSRRQPPRFGRLKATLVSTVALSPNGKSAASGSDDSTVRLWDAATGAAPQTLEGHSHRIWTVEIGRAHV